jgi:hypothetical protein
MKADVMESVVMIAISDPAFIDRILPSEYHSTKATQLHPRAAASAWTSDKATDKERADPC